MASSVDINGIGVQTAASLSEKSLLARIVARREAIAAAIRTLQGWIEERDYAGHEPYDILNSPLLKAPCFRPLPLQWSLIQIGKQGGSRLRRILRIPASKNPKALGLMLTGYCDRLQCGEDCWKQMNYLKSELRRLRSPREECFCWGYDWDYVALRGAVLPAFRANVIATVFCGDALLDMGQAGDPQAREMAESVGQFIVTRLNRSVDTAADLCFSYTPWDEARIFNSSALAGAFLARLGAYSRNSHYLELAKRSMHYLIRQQQQNGSWFYGARRSQRWIDGFHTGYNLVAMLEYRQLTGDEVVTPAIERGYAFYKQHFFDHGVVPKYFHDRVYPIDIHSCSQAIQTFCAFTREDSEAGDAALEIANWTVEHMRAPEGCFYYRRYHWRQDRTPYMRWGQAWMFRALARLQRVLPLSTSATQP
jgi:hypothetical protein